MSSPCQLRQFFSTPRWPDRPLERRLYRSALAGSPWRFDADVGRPLEHVERLPLAARVAQVPAVRPEHAGVVAHRAVLGEQRDRLDERFVDVRAAGCRARLGHRPPRETGLAGRRAGEGSASSASASAAAPSPAATAHADCSRRITARSSPDARRPRSASASAELLQRRARVVARRDHRVGAGHVGARQMNGVLRRLEQRDRTPEVVERRERPGLLEREPPQRPVQAHARVPVGHRARRRRTARRPPPSPARAPRDRSARS